jgi:hypothetical protein
MGDGMALAQGAVERLYEDEALRGDLTDEGAKAILDWASGALIASAEEIAQDADEQARATRMDAAEEAVRRVAKLLVRAAERHERDDVRALAGDPLVSENLGARLRLAANGWRLGDDLDRNAIRLAGALRGVRP